MILHLIKCEMCPNQFRIHPHHHPAENATPDGWMTLFQGDIRGSEGWHFCSDACLSTWLAKRSKDVVQEDYREEGLNV